MKSIFKIKHQRQRGAKQMTDNEIIKALENCYLKVNIYYCHNECPYNKGICDDKQIAKDTLDLINRQKVEISELEAELDDLKRDDLPRCKDALRRANEIGMAVDKENQELKAEIERLKEENKSLTFRLIPARGNGKSSVIKIKTDAIKAEAYKECIEKVKKKAIDYIEFGDADEERYYVEPCDNLLKEMVGEDK
jgi:hypothetical protein